MKLVFKVSFVCHYLDKINRDNGFSVSALFSLPSFSYFKVTRN